MYIEVSESTSVSKEKVWKTWSLINRWDEKGGMFKEGQKGVASYTENKGVRFQVTDICENKSFTIIWKGFGVRFLITHEVASQNTGSLITYRATPKGLFALPIRLFLGRKIKENLRSGLKGFIERLEAL